MVSTSTPRRRPRLDISLDVFDTISGSDELGSWNGFGVVVQAYQKRAPCVIDWLADMAHRHRRRLMVRLVKGAYWDTEIKLSQELALSGYPVYTRKVNTDVCFLVCARQLLADPRRLLPAVCHSQRPHHCRGAGVCRWSPRLRVPAFTRDGGGVVRGSGGDRRDKRALPDLRAGGRARGLASLPGATPARERRQQLVREPDPRRGPAGRPADRRPGGRGARSGICAPPAYPAPPRPIRQAAAQLRRSGSHRPGRAGAASSRHRGSRKPRMERRPDCGG